MASLDGRVSRIEGVIEQMNERIGNLEQGQSALHTELVEGHQALRTELAESQHALRAEMRSNFRWTVGIMLAMWITVIGAVLGALLTR